MSNAGKSLKALWSNMTVPARLSSILLLLVCASCFAWLTLVPPVDDQVFILGLLSPDEVRDVEVALGAASLNDFQVVNDRRIRVPRDEKAKYLQALQESDAIPDQWSEQANRWLDGGVFEPASVRRSKQEAERERAFAKYLEALPQIDLAAVEIDQLQGSFGQESRFVCSIQVQRQGASVESWVLKNIARHATKHFAGLTLDGVSIMDIGTGNLFEPSSMGLAADNPLLLAQMEWEEHYRTTLAELLSQYGEVRVGVSVQLDPTLKETSQVTRFEPDGMAIESIVNRSSTTYRPVAQHRSQLQLGANLPQALQANESESPGVETSAAEAEVAERLVADREDATERTTKQYGHQRTTTQVAGFVPKSIKLSIGIPESYYRKLYAFRSGVPDYVRTGSDREDWQQLCCEVDESVEAAVHTVPFSNDPDASKAQLRVYSYPDMSAELMEEPQPVPTASIAAAMADLEPMYWSLGGGCLMVTMLLVFLWYWKPRLVHTKSLDLQETDEAALGYSLDSAEGVVGHEIPEAPLPSNSAALSDLIKQNPAQAATLIQGWAADSSSKAA